MQRSLSPYSVTDWAKLFTSHLFALDFRVTSELRPVSLVFYVTKWLLDYTKTYTFIYDTNLAGGGRLFHCWGFNGSHCHLSLYLRMLSAKWCVSIAMFSPTMTQCLNLLHFKPEKGVSGSMRPKGPELGVVIMNLLRPRVY